MQAGVPHSQKFPAVVWPAKATTANGVEVVGLVPLEVDDHIGSPHMQTAAINNLIFTDISSLRRLTEVEQRISHAGLYQGIARKLIRGFNTRQDLLQFAARLSRAADHAYANRQMEVVNYVGRLLQQLPLPQAMEGHGLYYEALSLNRSGRGDTLRAGEGFEKVANNGSLQYRAKALMALGSNSFLAGDNATATSLYHESMKMVSGDRVFDPVTLCGSNRMLAVIKGTSGDHRGAVEHLENIFPLVRLASSIQPYLYYDYLNGLAVELDEVGRHEQARRASRIAISSPFAHAYPEWRETYEEIEARRRGSSRSSVVVPQSNARPAISYPPIEKKQSRNVLRLPDAEPRSDAWLADRYPQTTRPRVVNLLEWKSAFKHSASAKPERLSHEQVKRMTTGEKLIRLMDLVSRDETNDEMIDRILEVVEEIILNRRTQKLD